MPSFYGSHLSGGKSQSNYISMQYQTSFDTYTVTASGVTKALRTAMSKFSLQVTGTGAVPTTWTVILEGSLDNVNFTPIITHTQVSGNALILSTGSSFFPMTFYRTRCSVLVLGAATNIVALVLASE